MSDPNVGAIESGNSWNGLDAAAAPVIVTFSFPTSLAQYDQSIGGFTAGTISSFSAFTPAEQAQALKALGEWAAASGIIFVEVPPGQGDISFANVNFSTTTTNSVNGDYTQAAGIGFYPFGDWSSYTATASPGTSGATSTKGFTTDLSPAGAIFMNSAYQDPTTGAVNYGTLLHEIGHAIGLKHPDQLVTTADGTPHDQTMTAAQLAADPTIMSETGDANGVALTSLTALDQAAAADLYGPAGSGGVVTAAASGVNSVSTWSWDPTTNTLTQTAVAANETIHGTSVNDVIYGYDFGGTTPTSGVINLFGLDGSNTLYAGSGTTNLYGGPGANLLVGGAGNDSFYVYSAQTTVVDAYATGSNTLYAVGVSAALPENVDTLILSGTGLTGEGNDQNDSLYGSLGGSSTLIAGSGDDYMVGGVGGGNTLVAGAGVDTMYGSSGAANTFVFAAGDGTNLSTLDSIGDFRSGVDKIDLSSLAPSGVSLFFSATGTFTGVAGQVIAIADPFNANNTLLEADLTGAGVADFAVELYGATGVRASDLILSAVCFMAGTAISTPDGEKAVETLQPGDLVVLHDGRTAPVVWVGVQTIARRFADPTGVLPVRIRAGALDVNLPRRDLLVSPGHALLIGDVLFNAGVLVNGESILRETQVPDLFRYFHVELAAHELILAEGVPAETFLDRIERTRFDNDRERGDRLLAPAPADEMPYPRVKSPRQTPPAIRALLSARLEAFAEVQFYAA